MTRKKRRSFSDTQKADAVRRHLKEQMSKALIFCRLFLACCPRIRQWVTFARDDHCANSLHQVLPGVVPFYFGVQDSSEPNGD